MSEQINSLQDLFVIELRDVLDAEQQITKALPLMAEAAHAETVKAKFKAHLKQTEDQINRLKRVFELVGVEAEPEHCDGMEGLIKDGQKVLKAKGDPMAIDAALIAAAQKVEHYEIASYGTLRTFAQTLGYHDAARLLGETLTEEKDTDKLLTQVAEQSINKKAA